MKLGEAIALLRPGAEFNLRGETYEGLEWLDTVQTKPTREEVLEAIRANEYIEKRRKEYPPLIEMVEALIGGGDALKAVKDKFDALKVKYPKN